MRLETAHGILKPAGPNHPHEPNTKYKADWKWQILERLHRKLKKDGSLAILKKGLDVDNAHLDLLYRLPYNELHPEVTAKFESNVFSVTRQIYFSTVDQKSVDMVVFLNGLPLATLELKNPWTGQNVNHAKKQYRDDRDPKETLFHFKRCLLLLHRGSGWGVEMRKTTANKNL